MTPKTPKTNPEDFRPQSELQKLNSLTNWAVYFLLREFPMHFVSKLKLSSETIQRIEDYNDAVSELREEIRIDYKINKRVILKNRKKLMDSFSVPKK